MNRITKNGLAYYQFERWQHIKHGIFTRQGGVSGHPFYSLNVGANVGDDMDHVLENYRLVYDALEVPGEQACTVWQVHSADTIVVDGPVPGERWLAQADGMVTDRVGVPLTMRFADCTPILLYDPRRAVIGMAHAGWRGTVQGAASSAVRKMVETYGCNPVDIEAGIGPSIGPARYQVGEEVVEAVQAYYGEIDLLVQRDPADGTAYLNLWAANELNLRRAGVEQIEVAGICTAENTHEFYSHRAEGGKTGRFVAVLSL